MFRIWECLVKVIPETGHKLYIYIYVINIISSYYFQNDLSTTALFCLYSLIHIMLFCTTNSHVHVRAVSFICFSHVWSKRLCYHPLVLLLISNIPLYLKRTYCLLFLNRAPENEWFCFVFLVSIKRPHRNNLFCFLCICSQDLRILSIAIAFPSVLM